MFYFDSMRFYKHEKTLSLIGSDPSNLSCFAKPIRVTHGVNMEPTFYTCHMFKRGKYVVYPFQNLHSRLLGGVKVRMCTRPGTTLHLYVKKLSSMFSPVSSSWYTLVTIDKTGCLVLASFLGGRIHAAKRMEKSEKMRFFIFISKICIYILYIIFLLLVVWYVSGSTWVILRMW